MDDPTAFDHDALHAGAAAASEAAATALLPLFEAMPKPAREEPFERRLEAETVEVIA